MDWSAPDGDGVCTLRLDDPLRASLKGQRRLRRGAPQPLNLDAWPTDERQLLAGWVKRASDKAVRHDTLLRAAGPHRAMLADRLLDLLLRSGAIELEECHERGHWWPRQLRFLDPAALRRVLGLPEPDADKSLWDQARQRCFTHPELDLAAQTLDALPPARALARHGLLVALEAWQEQQRSGTWRDFSHFARGDTKQISDAEKTWLSSALSLDDFGISDHTPLLLVRLPTSVALSGGTWPLGLVPDFIALTPATINAMSAATGAPSAWRLVENRTSFERVARTCGPAEAVLWLPGYPPSWWRSSVTRLLDLLPAPAWIACDPDPDGIAIALQAGQLWTAAGLVWQPWRMGPADFDSLPAKRPLSGRDQSLLDRLEVEAPLPPMLAALARTLRIQQLKGEQEGYL
ncbi:hypothetical protein [Zoogloea sp.]|uniref:hypothetical protein n=1 Tax=Zoogloea sp. TaxID=49181 RepID=UPI001AD1AC9E|nr:hypothetical protein [Zoogloea sp.]MBN8285009.1 DUF2399 domain-containing protein [Zoogloea sp.]